MRAVSIAVLALALALAGSAAIAQGCANSTISSTPQCPQMTAPAPSANAPVCPGMVTEPSTGAAVGAGPEVTMPSATEQVCPGVALEQPSNAATMGAGPEVTTPSAAAPVCPGVIEQPSVVSQSVCPGSMVVPSSPAMIGAGPASSLANLNGADFDRAYIQQMYLLHTEISALATQGIEQTTDKNLKDLSGKIRYEQTTQNEKLALWAREMGLGKIPVDYSRVENILNTLTTYYGGADFDAQYANHLAALLAQERDAAQLGMTRLSNAEIRDQAGIEVKATTNEINALQRWMTEKSPVVPSGTVVPSTTVPGTTGAGPGYVAPGSIYSVPNPSYVAPVPGYTTPEPVF